MTTKIGKILALFIGIVGVAFLGFVAVTLVGGPNWGTKMRAADLRDYVFEKSEGDVPSWSVKKIHGDAAVGAATKIEPQAIVAARTDLKTRQSAEIGELDKDIDYWKEKNAEAEKFIDQDQKGIDQRISELQTELDALNAKIDEVSTAIREKARQVRETQAEATRRQEDVRFYENQLVQLQTDRFRIVVQQQALRDQLVRIRGTNEQLERRNEELKQSTAKQ